MARSERSIRCPAASRIPARRGSCSASKPRCRSKWASAASSPGGARSAGGPGEREGIMATKLPLTRPLLDEGEERAVLEVLRSGWLVQGPVVAEFERLVAEYVGARYGIATSSCTTALHLA